jgi:hypothetical protein
VRYKPGDKVVPVDKTVGTIGLASSVAWARAQLNNKRYLYIIHKRYMVNTKAECLCNDDVDSHTGDLFMEADLRPYPKESNDPNDVCSKTPEHYYLKEGDILEEGDMLTFRNGQKIIIKGLAGRILRRGEKAMRKL